MEPINLRDGATIAIIGGGPAGSFFAIHVLNLAKKLNKKINVTIFEYKNFELTGAKGCNRCAGVLQNDLLRSLEQTGIKLDAKLVQSTIEGYTFWLKRISADIKQKKDERIATVYRGGGPRHADSITAPLSFDRFLLDTAIAKGAQIIAKHVVEVQYPENPLSPVTIVYEKGETLQAELLVAAFGINTEPIKGLPSGYKAPKAWSAFQVEIEISDFLLKEKFHNMINIFFIKPKGVKYLAATPKDRYLTISAIGKDVTIRDLKTTISESELRDFLPDDWTIQCLCHPQIPYTAAKGMVDNRFIAIGDAACSRWLKNGIASAFTTSRYAAEAVMRQGVSKSTLRFHYQLKCLLTFSVDNFFGKVLFFLHDFVTTNKMQSYTYINLVNAEQDSRHHGKKWISDVLWHLYTGNAPYAIIFLKCLNPFLQMQLIKETLLLPFRRKRPRPLSQDKE